MATDLIREIKGGGFVLILVIGLGAVLRLLYIDAPLADDELAMTSIWAQMPIWSIPENYQYPNNHIFLTLILAVILKVVGVDHSLLRLPVLICGVMSPLLGYATTRKITRNPMVALGVALFLAVNTRHIYYSTNLRGYILIMLFSQLVVFWVLHVFWDSDSGSWIRPQKPIPAGSLFSLWLLCFLGTWTLPTFVIFEGALLVFFLFLLVGEIIDKRSLLESASARILLTLLLALVGFSMQYFVLISEEMLAGAMSRATVTGVHEFFPGILNHLAHAFDPFLPVLVILMGFGLVILYRNNKCLFALIFLILLPFPILIWTAHLLGFLKSLPAPRVFVYLQPFFYLCIAIGGYETISLVIKFLRNRFLVEESSVGAINIVYLALFLPIGYLAGSDLSRNIYPERAAREPFHIIHRFIKNSGPHDLFMISNKTHVEFFLYGAWEMRQRLESIIESGELGNIYFIGSDLKGSSDMELIREGDKEFFLIRDYLQVGESSDFLPFKIPARMLKVVMRAGNLIIYKLNSDRVHKVYALTSPDDLKRWTVYGEAIRMGMEQIRFKTGNHWAIRYSKHFKMISKVPETVDPDAAGLNLKFFMATNSNNPNAFYLDATGAGKTLEYQPAWTANAWTLDHPYGMQIYNRPWKPWIFISESTTHREVVHVQQVQPNSPNTLWGLQSYRLEFAENEIQTAKGRP